MKRRDLVYGFAWGAARATPQPPEAESLYIPKAQRVEDRALLEDFMNEFPFVELVTASPSIRITHLPVFLDRSAGRFGTLYGHIAPGNAQSRGFDGRQPAVAVFRGPHSYISPGWYAKPGAGPTWNFAVVHAGGKPRRVTDNKAVYQLMAQLVKKFEDRYGSGAYDFTKLPDSATYGRFGTLAAFEMPIDTLEGKFKLGQERGEADRASLLKHLREAKPERALAEFAESFYARASGR